MVSRKGSDFLKRTIKNVVVFNDSINIIVNDLKAEGYKTINLVGKKINQNLFAIYFFF